MFQTIQCIQIITVGLEKGDEGAADVDKTYIEEVLPRKMKHNLRSIEEFNFFGEIKTMVRTVFAVAGKEYKDE
jgi:lipopolysaccharide/colanic/teichoic acid biosynthesis glycosyltransferase